MIAKRIRHGRNLASVLVASVALFGAPQAALADSKTVGGWTYQSNLDCPHIRGTISNNARPRMDSTASIDWFTQPLQVPSNCSDQWYKALPGYLTVRQDLAKWNGSQWTWCNFGPFVYNQTHSHNVSTGFGWQSPPCGAGYYYAAPGSWFYNGGWHGGMTFTQYIHVS